jgi:hypothetical protein
VNSSREIPKWALYAFLLIGAYIILISLDIIHYVPSTRKRAIFSSPHNWQITSIGIAFFFLGLAFLFEKAHLLIRLFVGSTILLSFCTPVVWFLFYSNEVNLLMQIFGGFCLACGFFGGLAGLIQTARGKSADFVVDDPITNADYYVKYGRKNQAIELLSRAAKNKPDKAALYLAKIAEIQSDSKT